MANHNSAKSGFYARHRWLVWGLGVIMAVILLASFASRDDSVPVTAASVSRKTIRSVISTNGKIEPVQNFEAHAPIGTTVKRVLVKEGDHVKRGQMLVELNAASARSQAAQAQAQVRTAEANASALERGGNQEEVLTLQAQLVKARGDSQIAQRNLDALQRLQQSGAASPGEVRAAQNQLDAAAAQVKLLESKQKERYSHPEIAQVQAQQSGAQSALNAAQDVLSQLLVRAPFDGEVYSLPVKAGTYVNPGDLILQEADLSKVLVRAYVDEPDVAKLARGERIELTWDAMPGKMWTGQVNAVPASVKLHGARNVGETTCIVGNQDFKLLPNINVGVTIVTAEHDNVLAIPREALRQEESGPFVFQIVNHELKRQSVQTSISNLTSVEVASGISENALVAIGSTNSKPLRDSLTVKVVH
ncbi:MAG: efflux transporter periplasmic adaptor subunit [Acidobacteria bacterium]|nr:MAG: efflux transporter periplasmic adaptor subunit [Acidobacteriota bacterium]